VPVVAGMMIWAVPWPLCYSFPEEPPMVFWVSAFRVPVFMNDCGQEC
jgi:hypothetical protein